MATRADARGRRQKPPARRPRRPARRRTVIEPAPKVRHERGRPVHAEIVAVGRELLRGRTAETNASYVAAYLSGRGAVVHRITVVDDNERAIASVVKDAFGRGAHLVITTGGLGPTLDDRTLEGVAQAVGHPLSAHPRARVMVEAAYARLHERKLVSSAGSNVAREKMCAIPVGSEPVENPRGVAPGMLLRLAGGAAVLALPGVPDEMRAVLEAALSRLKDLLPRSAVVSREIEAPTSDESALRPILDRVADEHPRVSVKSLAPGFGPQGAPVIVTLEAAAPTQKEAESLVDGALRRLLSLAGSRAVS